MMSVIQFIEQNGRMGMWYGAYYPNEYTPENISNESVRRKIFAAFTPTHTLAELASKKCIERVVNSELKEKKELEVYHAKLFEIGINKCRECLNLKNLNSKKELKELFFCVALAKSPYTMVNIKAMDWNEKNAGFYDVYKALEKAGIAARTKIGEMYIIDTLSDFRAHIFKEGSGYSWKWLRNL